MKSMHMQSAASTSKPAVRTCMSIKRNGMTPSISLREQRRRQPRISRSHFVTVNAIQVSGPSNPFDETPESVSDDTARISKQLILDMQVKIRRELEADTVSVTDTYGDGRHVSIDVVSNIFEGQSSVKRQRLVYKAIWVELQNVVHAVDSMTTKTPAEVAAH